MCYSTTKFVEDVDTTIRINSGNDYSGLLSMRGQNNNDNHGTSLHKFLYMGQDFED